MNVVFRARYSGRCPACEEPIKVDQPVVYNDDEKVVHADCDTAAPTARPERPPCPSCHMVPAANGVCECD